MADEEHPLPLGFLGTKPSVMRKHLCGGQIVSGFVNQQPLDMVNPQLLVETPGMTSVATDIGKGMKTNQAVEQQNQQEDQKAQEVPVHEHTSTIHHQQQQQQRQEQQHQEQQPQQQQQPGINLQSNHQESMPADAPQASFRPPEPPNQKQKKPVNSVFICKLGYESVQNIQVQALEIFHILRRFPLPNGTAEAEIHAREKMRHLQDKLRVMRLKFKHLRRIVDKCNENCQMQGMEYTDIESLVPLKENCNLKPDQKKTSEAYRLAFEEKKSLIEQVQIKNRQLKDIIFHLRRLLCEINVMLHMRRT